MKRRNNPEQQFQISLVRDLRKILAGGVFITAFPAGGGGYTRGAFLKAMGLVPGVPDLMLIYQGRIYFMELKARRRRMSAAQVDCRLTLRHVGASVEVVENLDEALAALRVWQIPTRISPIKAENAITMTEGAG